MTVIVISSLMGKEPHKQNIMAEKARMKLHTKLKITLYGLISPVLASMSHFASLYEMDCEALKTKDWIYHFVFQMAMCLICIRGLSPFTKPISALRSLPGVAILRCGKSNSIISQFVIL